MPGQECDSGNLLAVNVPRSTRLVPVVVAAQQGSCDSGCKKLSNQLPVEFICKNIIFEIQRVVYSYFS